jgi:hypothetical protein
LIARLVDSERVVELRSEEIDRELTRALAASIERGAATWLARG